MRIATISSKGRLVLPTEIRRRLHWDAGTKLVVEETPNGVLLRKAGVFAPTKIEDVFGCLKYNGPPKSLEEMDAAVGEAVMERYERSR